MPTPDDLYADRARDLLARYTLALRRDVVHRLVKPRTPIPEDELADRCLATLANPPVVDRRIKDLPDAARKLIALIGLSRRSEWKVGHLITMLAAIGHPDGFAPVLELLASGLLFPDLRPLAGEVTAFDAWLARDGGLDAKVVALPMVARRARTEAIGLPTLPAETLGAATPRFADGLDWPLRLAVVWQQVEESPVRLTQANSLFKRDLGRLQADEVLTAATDQPVAVADPGVLSLFWAASAGLLQSDEGDLKSAPFPPSWGAALPSTLIDLWAALAAVEPWDPLLGYTVFDSGLSPTPTAGLLATLLLATAPPGQWVEPQLIADWLWEHHPSWQGVLPAAEAKVRGNGWVEAWLLGVLYPLRVVEATTFDGWRVRLSDLGRHLVGSTPEPTAAPAFPQTLLVQPNAEVLAYRQGLTPALVGRLTRFAKWKNLGPACTLELTPTRTYHGLESGLTLAGILQTLNQHGMRPVPPAVEDLLGRWANKRDRITVYPSATLVEFQAPADLEAAISRGVVSVRVTDRIGLADDGRDPDFKNLRLIGNRDYEAKPQMCVTIAADGVTLAIDPAQSDLLLEAEIVRIAEPVPADPPAPRRFRLTPATLRRALATGFTLADLDTWFFARTGFPMPAAGRMFVVGSNLSPPTSSQVRIVEVATAELADGLVQWPETSALITRRLGPTALVVDDEQLAKLQDVLAELGMRMASEGSTGYASGNEFDR